jgi:hypothetical protein
LLTLYAPPLDGMRDMIDPRFTMAPRRWFATIQRATAWSESSTP